MLHWRCCSHSIHFYKNSGSSKLIISLLLFDFLLSSRETLPSLMPEAIAATTSRTDHAQGTNPQSHAITTTSSMQSLLLIQKATILAVLISAGAAASQDSPEPPSGTRHAVLSLPALLPAPSAHTRPHAHIYARPTYNVKGWARLTKRKCNH